MKQALSIYVLVLAGTHLAFLMQGYVGTAEILFGALTIMALMISAIFLWLWGMRMSPLSLGMAFSWAGSAMVMGWGWLSAQLGRPAWMNENELLLLLMGLLMTGAVLHFEVLETSFGYRRGAFLLPVAGALLFSSLLLALVG
ncbi:hypothetical protein [Aliiruegeria sabulilitoris]|uniref:hypothetical protein n=1 Tax=Aliiruegeria sabulilitoris TaxID=1510458 RepID=UPI000831E8A0|nr:hypothetical protein [Aliiruegeria sabulilitoris]NDR56511.1 hypothetical protein [Pseudoruegeria sp. M32A2M]